ncbi:MAG: SAM-dependent methyltransferase [Pseudonocardiaceae bacterium]
MFSVAEDSYACAVRELRDEFGRALKVERLGPDLGVLTTAAPKVGEVAAACARRPLVFLRHLSLEVARVEGADAAELRAVRAAALSVVTSHVTCSTLAVHTWAIGAPRIGYSSGDLFTLLATDLAAHGIAVARAGCQHILSCCITPSGVCIGLNRAEDSLADWPGGRVRLARDTTQISRAEFKLEELFQLFPLDLPEKGRAVDLGASPGGWTRILRQRGMTVWAVDPGDLDPRVAADSEVHHARTTAGEFFRSTDKTFDLAVNDMRMDPLVTSEVMIDTARHLRPGGLAIVTLKTGTRQPVETVRRCLAILGRAYEIKHARQLHHNRHEVTVVARRKLA